MDSSCNTTGEANTTLLPEFVLPTLETALRWICFVYRVIVASAWGNAWGRSRLLCLCCACGAPMRPRVCPNTRRDHQMDGSWMDGLGLLGGTSGRSLAGSFYSLHTTHTEKEEHASLFAKRGRRSNKQAEKWLQVLLQFSWNKPPKQQALVPASAWAWVVLNLLPPGATALATCWARDGRWIGAVVVVAWQTTTNRSMHVVALWHAASLHNGRLGGMQGMEGWPGRALSLRVQMYSA